MPPQPQQQQQGPAQQPQPPQQQAPQRSNLQKVKDLFKRNGDQANAVVAQQLTDQIQQSGANDVSGIVTTAKDTLKQQLKGALAKKLQIKMEILQAHAKGTVDSELARLQAELNATDRQLADVKAGSANLGTASGAAGAAITAESEKAAGELVGGLDFSAATTAGNDVYAGFHANASKGKPKESARAHSEAAAAMAPTIGQQGVVAMNRADANAKGTVYDERLKTAVAAHVKSTNVSGKDLQKRKDKDAAVEAIAGTTAATAAYTAVHDDIKAYLEDKLGAKGAHFWRSKELKDFRGKVKTDARATARDEVDAQIGQGGGAQQEYTRMVAKSESYGGAKGIVNDHLTVRAGEGTKEIVEDHKDEIVAQLIAVASPAAWGAMHDVADPKAANAAGEKAAAKALATKKQALITDKRALAKTWKDKIVGKDGNVSQAAQESDKVKEKVKTQKDSNNTTVAQRAVTAASGEEALGVLGHIIDLAAPHNDTSCELEIAFKIPLSHGAFLEFSVKGSAEREEDGVTTELAFIAGAGWETFGISAAAHFQMFLEAKGKTTRDAVLLLQYGLYRRLGDKSPELAGIFAGKRLKEGRTDMSRAEMNETWAAMVEERAMTGDDYHVTSGVGADLTGKLNAGGLKAEGSLEYRSGTKYDKNTLGAGKLGKLDHGRTPTGTTTKSRGERETIAKQTAGEKRRAGESTSKLSAELAFEVQAGSFRFNVGGSLSKEGEEYEGELSFAVPFSPGSTVPPGTANAIIGKFVPMAAGAIKTAYENIKAKNQDTSGAQRAGAVVDGAGDVLSGIDSAVAMAHGDLTSGLEGQLGNVAFAHGNPTNFKSDDVNDTIGKALHTDQTTSSASPFSTESALEVAFGLKYDAGTKKWTPSISFSQKKTMEVAVGGFGAGMTVGVEKKQKLFGKEFA